jgi:predicted AAA+ superfamily ATPase
MYERPQAAGLRERLNEPPRQITIVAGPRQVGKTTLVHSVLNREGSRFIAVDQYGESSTRMQFDIVVEPTTELPGARRDAAWLINQWQSAREACQTHQVKQADQASQERQPFVLAIDEIQKVERWSEVVKGLWDADRAANLPMHVILLGSSPLLMQKGLTESLMGRYELITLTHWVYPEMQEAFDFTLDEYLYFGGYPGSAPYIRDEERWRNYVLGSLVQPSIDTDILQMTRVDKPALLKQLFTLGCNYSGQILALGKVKGQLEDAGNETTLAGYLDLLGNAGLLVGLHKYHRGVARQRKSPPKFNALNTGLMSSAMPYTFAEAQADRTHWGRLVESAVGAHLCNTARQTEQVHYWRESPQEVDFVISDAKRLTAIEVKSSTSHGGLDGLQEFARQHPHCHRLLVGAGGVPLPEFLSHPLSYWLEQT